MSKYVFKRRQDGVHIINVHKTYEKILFAARIIAAIENPLVHAPPLPFHLEPSPRVSASTHTRP
jgi:hypothetical protein